MEDRKQQLSLSSFRSPGRQEGAVVIILAVGLIALIAVAGLALDSGNIFLNKSKLQNAVDDAALSAAAALNAPGGNYDKARSSAIDRFTDIMVTPGNEALSRAYNSGDVTLTITTSPTLNPFVGGAADGDWYVRVSASAITLDSFFLKVIGIQSFDVPATAVAGRRPVGIEDAGGGNDTNPLCGIAPMMVCGNPDQSPATGDSFWGYAPGQTQILKSTANCQSVTGNGDCVKPATADDWSIGPGNFQLIQLTDQDGSPLSGGAGVGEAMAGSEASCINGVQGEQIPTEPGNTVGPVVQGVNTRFGIYTGSMSNAATEYPSDYVPGQPPGTQMDYSTYKTIYDNGEQTSCAGCDASGAEYRRIIAVPIGDCSDSVNGSGDVPLLDMGCFFLTKRATQQGNNSEIYGEFVADCPVSMTPPTGEGPTSNNGGATTPGGNNNNQGYIIQLYKDPTSRDS